MMLLTVFTPTFNRAHTLERTYKSLCNQTCKDFVWFVIDDGSTDNTKKLVETWSKNSNGYDIEYYYKENGGLHTAYNLAIEHLESELAVCIDSDDYMPNNAVELIKEKWLKDGSDSYAGITGLDFDTEGNVIGTYYPKQYDINLIDVCIGKYPKVKGDKKHVVRSDLYKLVAPMKSFQGEKNFNPHYMHIEISKKYNFLILNKELCTVDYQQGGMTDSIFKQYYNSPNSFAELRKQTLSLNEIGLKFKTRAYIHLVAESMLAKKYQLEFKQSKDKVLMTICTIPGIILYYIIQSKGKER